MALVSPVIFQIVGYQNSGKTTAMLEVVKELSKEGFKVTTIKHHGHGGKPDLAEKKDSYRHVAAGGLASLIEGEGRVIIHAEKAEWSLQEQLQLLSSLTPDIILIEGHKHASFPKAVLLRDIRDIHLLEELENIKVVLYRDSKNLEQLRGAYSFPMYTTGEEIYAWMIHYLKNEVII